MVTLLGSEGVALLRDHLGVALHDVGTVAFQFSQLLPLGFECRKLPPRILTDLSEGSRLGGHLIEVNEVLRGDRSDSDGRV